MFLELLAQLRFSSGKFCWNIRSIEGLEDLTGIVEAHRANIFEEGDIRDKALVVLFARPFGDHNRVFWLLFDVLGFRVQYDYLAGITVEMLKILDVLARFIPVIKLARLHQRGIEVLTCKLRGIRARVRYGTDRAS